MYLKSIGFIILINVSSSFASTVDAPFVCTVNLANIGNVAVEESRTSQKRKLQDEINAEMQQLADAIGAYHNSVGEGDPDATRKLLASINHILSLDGSGDLAAQMDARLSKIQEREQTTHELVRRIENFTQSLAELDFGGGPEEIPLPPTTSGKSAILRLGPFSLGIPKLFRKSTAPNPIAEAPKAPKSKIDGSVIRELNSVFAQLLEQLSSNREGITSDLAFITSELDRVQLLIAKNDFLLKKIEAMMATVHKSDPNWIAMDAVKDGYVDAKLNALRAQSSLQSTLTASLNNLEQTDIVHRLLEMDGRGALVDASNFLLAAGSAAVNQKLLDANQALQQMSASAGRALIGLQVQNNVLLAEASQSGAQRIQQNEQHLYRLTQASEELQRIEEANHQAALANITALEYSNRLTLGVNREAALRVLTHDPALATVLDSTINGSAISNAPLLLTNEPPKTMRPKQSD